MTRRLILIRHAKSSWDDPFGDDHDRVLNGRGRTSANAIGEWMAANGYQPDVVLCSDAVRTQQTAEIILPCLPEQPDLMLLGAIYHAAPDTILDLVQRQTAATVAVIGHNPGIGMLANALVAKAPAHRRFNDYPTCATTVLEFACEAWQDIKRGSGECVDFTVPRDLIGTANHDID